MHPLLPLMSAATLVPQGGCLQPAPLELRSARFQLAQIFCVAGVPSFLHSAGLARAPAPSGDKHGSVGHSRDGALLPLHRCGLGQQELS